MPNAKIQVEHIEVLARLKYLKDFAEGVETEPFAMVKDIYIQNAKSGVDDYVLTVREMDLMFHATLLHLGKVG